MALGSVEVRKGGDVLVVPGGRVRRLLRAEAIEAARAIRYSASAFSLRRLIRDMGFGVSRAPDEAEVSKALMERCQVVELVDDRWRWGGPPVAHKPRELPHVPDARPLPTSTWVAVVVIDDDAPGRPLAGASFRLRLPDASIVTGVLDRGGHTRVDDIEPGKCWIELTDIERGKSS
jgi:hypothetical protein